MTGLAGCSGRQRQALPQQAADYSPVASHGRCVVQVALVQVAQRTLAVELAAALLQAYPDPFKPESAVTASSRSSRRSVCATCCPLHAAALQYPPRLAAVILLCQLLFPLAV